MAEIVHIGSGLNGDDYSIFKDNRTYLLNNHLVPRNGYLVKLRLSILYVGEPIKVLILRRNKKGKLKKRDGCTITPLAIGDQVFSVQDGTLKVMKITKRDFIAIRIPNGGSLLNFKEKNKDRILYKKGNWNSDNEEKIKRRLALKMRAKVSLVKAGIEPIDQAKGNFLVNFNNGKYEIGDFTKNNFNLVIKGQKFDENTWFQIEYKTNNIEYVSSETEDDVITKITIKLNEAQEEIDKIVLYPKDESVLNDDGALEYELHLNQKPSSNKIRFNIDYNNIAFYPQPAYDLQDLPPEDLAKGVDYRTATEGRAGGPTGKLIVKNPQENVDSIAMYKIDGKKFHHDEDESEAYGGGKLGVIERIKITDSNEDFVWGEQELKYNENQDQWKYIITIPQSFLDNAVYPIIVDPTFGYTTLGGTSWQVEDTLIGYVANPGETGCCCDLFCGMGYWVSPDPVKMALYDDTDSLLLAPQSMERSEGHVGNQFEQFPIVPLVGGGIFIENKNYIIAAWFGGDTDIRRDLIGVPGTSKYVNITYDGWPVNPTFFNSSYAYSTYAFYNQVTPENWGITSQVVNNTFSPDYIMYMGGITPDTPDLIARQIRVRVTGVSSVAVALYVGGQLDDPTGAIKITEAYAVPVVAGWNSININPVIVPNNAVAWIGVCIGDANSIYYSDQPSDSGDFQSIRGNWRDTLPENHDANTPLPINPQPGSFENNYLQIYLVYTVDAEIRGSINAITQDTTIISNGFVGILGDINTTLGEVEISATGTPVKEGTIDATLPEVQIVATGTPIKEGTIDATLEEVEISATGEKIIYGEIDATLPEVQIDASGQKIIKGNINQVLPEVSINMSGEKFYLGSIETTLDEVQIVATGEKIIEGEIDATLDEVEIVATALNFAPNRGTIEVTLDEVEIDAIGFVYEKYTGEINAILPEVEINATGTPIIEGVINATLDEVQIDAQGTPIKKGSIDATLEEVQIVATGTPIKEGTIETTLEEVQIVATGEKIIEGIINTILPEVQIEARGGRMTTGEINAVLPEVIVSEFYGSVISRPISIDLIKYGIQKAIKCSFDGPVIWEDQEGHQPNETYISLRFQNLNKLTWDDPYIPFNNNDDIIEYIGNREYEIKITAWGGEHKAGWNGNSMAILEEIKSYISDSNSCEFIGLAKSAFIEATDIINLTVYEDIKNVERAEMTARFRTYAQYRRETLHIEQVDLTTKYHIEDVVKEVNQLIKEN